MVGRHARQLDALSSRNVTEVASLNVRLIFFAMMNDLRASFS